MGLPLILLYLMIPTLLAQDCGIAPNNTQIAGGMNASAGTWPWQVSLYLGSNHTCGGTLINREWVLSAAHCMISPNTSEWTVYLGRNIQNTTNLPEVNRTVQQIIVHPFYNSTMMDNDVVLIKLSNPVNFTNDIRPICLASAGSVFNTDTTCWATGWGNATTNYSLPTPNLLQKVQVPVVGNKQCSCQRGNSNITTRNICSGGGQCVQRNSGGPLQCHQNSVWVQAGIERPGMACGGGDYPDVYTRVSEFQAWITQHVNQSTIGFVTFNSSSFNADDYFVCDDYLSIFSSSGANIWLPTRVLFLAPVLILFEFLYSGF